MMNLPNLQTFISHAATSARPGKKLVRRGPSPMVLEQRFMFDGAAVADATHTLDAAVLYTLVDKAISTAPSALVTAQAEAQRLVTTFLTQPDARAQLFALFNGGQSTATPEWQAAFDQLMASLTSGDGAVKVELRTSAELQGAKGAFTSSGTDGKATIYLNADWLNAGADSASITAVLLEELGHSLDARLNNGADTPGDEGERFSRVLLGGIDPYTQYATSSQDDRGVLQLDGQTVNVEFANYTFVNAYKMVYDLNKSGGVNVSGESAAAKEQSGINFNPTSLGQVTIDDGSGSQQFSGNDVSATIVVGGVTYHGWISRPIKSNGDVKGFYFWTDINSTTLALAQADGNADADGNSADNRGFVLVVDQAWFTTNVINSGNLLSLPAATGSAAADIDGTTLPSQYATVGSSSDRVDSGLNPLVTANVAPVAANDVATGTPGTTGGAALEQGFNSNTNAIITATIAATGNVITNDTAGGDTLTVTQITSGSKGTTASVTGSTNVLGQYGTLTIGTDGVYSYAVDNSHTTVDALLSGNVSETFTYTISDGKGGTASATLTVQINGSNDAPVAANDYNVAKEITTTSNTGFTATGSVLTNDKDVDTGDTKAITGLTLSGGASVSTVTVDNGSTKLIFLGGSGFSSVNGGEELYVSLSGTTGSGTTYSGIYNLNGSTYTLVNVSTRTTVGSDSTIVMNATATHYWSGTAYVAISDLATFLTTYSKVLFENSTNQTENSNGGKEATVSSSASTANTTLTALSGISGTVAVGMGVTGTGVPEGTKVSEITYTAGALTSIKLDKALTSTSGGSFTFSGAGSTGVNLQGAHGILNLAAGGTYTYTPTTDNPNLSSGQSAIEVFDYTMQDAAGVTSAAKLYITVYGSGSSDPVVVADTTTAYESGVGRASSPSPYALTSDNTAFAGVTTAVTVLSNDTPGSGGVVAAYTKADGTSSTNAGSALIGTYGTLSMTSAGVVTYTVDNTNGTVNALLPGSTLTETFRYQVSNTALGVNWSTLTITIQGTNDAPVAVVDTGTVSEDNVLTTTGSVLTNDTDVDSGDTKTVSMAIAGSVTPTTVVSAGTTSANGLSIGGTYGTLVLGADGTYKYTLATSADATRYAALQALTNGTVVSEVFTYEVKDTNGATSTTTLTISVTGANELPVNQLNDTAISSTATTAMTTAKDTALVFTGSNALSVTDADNNLTSVSIWPLFKACTVALVLSSVKV